VSTKAGQLHFRNEAPDPRPNPPFFRPASRRILPQRPNQTVPRPNQPAPEEPSSMDLDLRVMELASTQHGVVSRQQLLALGLSSRMVARWRRQGRLRRIHRGIYLVGAVLPLWAAEQAALLASGPQAVLSHWTAARMVDLPVPGDVRSDVVHVNIPVSGGGRRPGFARTGQLRCTRRRCSGCTTCR
jgi:hypothetical protein